MTTICEVCKNENRNTDSFCTQCGNRLPKYRPRTTDELSERIRILEQELDSIKKVHADLNDDDAAQKTSLAQNSGLQTLSERSSFAVPADSEAYPGKTSDEIPESSRGKPLTEPSDNPLTDRMKLSHLENIFGGNWLVRVGVVAIFVGITFLLKFAFDENLVQPGILILAGLMVGAGFLVFGEVFWSRYPLYAHALSGGGVAILYSCLLAASVPRLNETPVINPWLTIALMLIVSILSVRLSLIKNSQPLALLGVIGALSAPFLYAGISGPDIGTTIEEQKYFLIAYVLTVDIGVLIVAISKNWTWFKLISVLGSYAGYGLWLGLADFFDFSNPQIHITLPALSLLFLMMLASVSGFHIVQRRTPGTFDYSPMIWNGILYAGISYALLHSDNNNLHAFRGIPTLAVGLLHLCIAYLALVRNRTQPTLAFMLAGIGIVCITIFIPMQFGGYPLIIGMSANAFVMIALSTRTKSNELRLLALASFVFTILRLLSIGTSVDEEDFQVIFNIRFVTFIWTILALYGAAFVYQKYRTSFTSRLFEIPSWIAIKENLDRNARWLYRSNTYDSTVIFLIASAQIVSVWLLTTEVVAFADYQLGLSEDLENQAKLLSITVSWAVYAALVIVTGTILRATFIRLAGLGMLAVTVFKLFLVDTFALDQLWRVSAYIVLGIVLLSGGFMYQRYQNRMRGFFKRPFES